MAQILINEGLKVPGPTSLPLNVLKLLIGHGKISLWQLTKLISSLWHHTGLGTLLL